jgi:chemotaxis signal transduction protein
MDEDSRFLILSLGGGSFALPITTLLEITVPRGIRNDSDLPPVFEGVFEFRGRPVPVLDARKALKLGGAPGPVLLVVRTAKNILGVLVDAVIEIIDAVQKPEGMPPGVVSTGVRCYRGVIRHKGELILLLNEDGLLQ